MSRLLYVSGDTELAKRTLRLYIEVVSKTRAAGVDGDSDTDRCWVETLVEGARMFCRLALSRHGSGGVEEAKEAGEFLEKAKTRLDPVDKELVARVALAEGIWNTVTAIIGTCLHLYWDFFVANPLKSAERYAHTRTTKLRNALQYYIHAVEQFPTPGAHHQLALALALPGPSQNLEDAITSASAAVEGAPNEIRHWHLLGLLLTAQGEWVKAQEVLEFGATINESPSETDDSQSDTEAASERTEKSEPSGAVAARDHVDKEKGEPEVHSHDGNGVITNEVCIHEMILDPDAVTIPPSATLLHTLPDHPGPTPQDAFEYALQLRLTQMALTEHVEGPEGAETKWVDVFGWIAERKGTVSETQCT
jgi:tetratricopeptide (TPR) repeat protein